MDLLRVDAASGAGCALGAGLERVIAALGTPAFEAMLFKAVGAATASAHLSAFVFTPGRPPRVLCAMTRDSLQAARHCAERYMAEYWPSDPTLRLHDTVAANAGTALIRSRPADIEHAAYRAECYSDVHLVERISAVSRIGDDTVRLHVYRGRGDGTFDGMAIDSLARHARVLAALVLQHDRTRPAPRRAVADRLREMKPPMPTRERQVCEGIATGMTSEAISLELSISLNTVLSYRKRAYARLGITSQTELMHLLFGLRQ